MGITITTSVRIQQVARIDEIMRHAKNALRPADTSDQDSVYMPPKRNLDTVIMILKEMGLDSSAFHTAELSNIASTFFRQNLSQNMPLQSAAFAEYDSFNSPVGFWNTLPGILEAKRRYDEFFLEKERRPTLDEFNIGLKLHRFYIYNRKKG